MMIAKAHLQYTGCKLPTCEVCLIGCDCQSTNSWHPGKQSLASQDGFNKKGIVMSIYSRRNYGLSKIKERILDENTLRQGTKIIFSFFIALMLFALFNSLF